MQRLAAPALVALALAAASLSVAAYSTVYGCAGMSVEGTEPGAPPAQPECVREFTPMLLLTLVPPLFVALGVLLARPGVAWSAAGIDLLATWAFPLSTQALRLTLGLATLGALGWWHRKAVPRRTVSPGQTGRKAAIASAAAVAALALAVSLPQIPDFWDPCHTWGHKGGGSASIQAGDPCSSMSMSSLTRSEHAMVLAFLFGVPVLASAAVVWASLRNRGAVLVASGVVLAMHGMASFLFALPSVLITGPVAALWIVLGLSGARPPPAGWSAPPPDRPASPEDRAGPSGSIGRPP